MPTIPTESLYQILRHTMAAVTTSEKQATDVFKETDMSAKMTDYNHVSPRGKQSFNIIEAEDQNYLDHVSKPPYLDSGLTEPLNETVARKWIDDVVMNLPRGPPADCRRRNPVQVTTENVSVTYGSDSTFRVRVYTPVLEVAAQRPALLMYHGGAWIHGYPEVDEDLAVFFSSELRAVVVNVDYRLAPEFKFPLPLNDCYQAIQWTIDNAAKYGIDTSRIALWGCSAGGNLASAVAIRDAEEHDKPRICHVNIIVPATCHPDLYPRELDSADASVNKFDTGFERPGINIMMEKYAEDKTKDTQVSVLHANIPSNHPPVHTTVAGRDFLRDEGIAYSLRLRNAGVDSQLEIVPGAPHGVTFPPTTHMAKQLFKNQTRVLDYALNVL